MGPLQTAGADTDLTAAFATPGEPPRLLTATELAERIGVSRSWVYEHARELGAVRLGPGPRARLRFDPVTVAARLAGPPAPRFHHELAIRETCSTVPLLPINHEPRRRPVAPTRADAGDAPA